MNNKKSLVQSFHNFTGNTVSAATVDLAKMCIMADTQHHERYSIINFDRYLELNKEIPSHLTMMTSAYDLLLKYIINLLKAKKPQVWRSIKTNNTAFRARVACMNGAEEILKLAGYEEERENSICFPDSVEEPDKARLAIIAAELLMAKLEVEQLNNTPSQSPQQQYSTGSSIQLDQRFDSYKGSTLSQPSGNHPPLSRFNTLYQNGSRYESTPPQSIHYSTISQIKTDVSSAQQQSSYGTTQQQARHNTSQQFHTYAQPSNAVPNGLTSVSSQQHPSTRELNSYNVTTLSRVPAHESNSGPQVDNVSSGYSSMEHRWSGQEGHGYEQGAAPPPSQYSGEQPTPSARQPVPKPRTRKKVKSSDTPPVSPASQGSQPSHPTLASQESHPALASQDSLEHSQSSEVFNSLGSQHSSCGEDQSVLTSAKNFLNEYKAKKGIREKNTQRTVDHTSHTGHTRHSPLASRKASTMFQSPANNSDASSSGLKLPPNKKQPSFYNDPILEDNPPEPQPVPSPPVAKPRQIGSSQRPDLLSAQGQADNMERRVNHTEPVIPEAVCFCRECKNKLNPKDRFCSYCGTPANDLLAPAKEDLLRNQKTFVQELPQPTKPHSVQDPLKSQETFVQDPLRKVEDPPRRVSHQDAIEAEEYHKTRVLNISTQQFTPVEPSLPPLPPKPKPRPTPPGKPKQAWAEPTAPPRPPKPTPSFSSGRSQQQPSNTVHPQQQPSNSGHLLQQTSNSSRPHHQPSNIGLPQANSGEKVFNSAEFYNLPGMLLLREKEEAFQNKQRRDGVPEHGLQPLDELEKAKRDFMTNKGRLEGVGHVSRIRSPPVDPRVFPRTDTSKLCVDLTSDPRETSRVEEMRVQGAQLLNSIKRCTSFGYSLDEIQIAFDHGGCGLDYLQQEWREATQQAQRNMSLYKSEKGSVGVPSDHEMRAALATARGNVQAAEQAVFWERESRVKALLKRVDRMRVMNQEVPPLSWEGAVQVLSANSMDVDTAFYVLQCDWLKPLHDYIFDETNKNVVVNQQDMEDIKKIITNKEFGNDFHLRLLMAECITSISQAKIVLQLLTEVEGVQDSAKYPLQYYIEAAKDHGDIEKARKFLIKECPLCLLEYPVHEFVAMPGCNHAVCKDCFRGNFTVVVKEKEVKHFNCPVCGEPNMANQDITEGFYLQLFLHLVKEHLDKEAYKLCDEKINEFSLLKDHNFIWCANTECRCGFIHEGRADDVTCPYCRKSMCRKCKKPWEPAHEGISCEAFAKWKIDNDPDAQEQGLAAHLQANGIECPQCHFKYDLARGGCMHFKCVKCPNEFCSGCGQSFKQGQQCGKLESCKTRGLHAHHPRDCLFYMRDFDVAELQKFLTDNQVAYDTEVKQPVPTKPPAGQPAEQGADEAPVQAPPEDGANVAGCKVMLQKETMEGLKDEECGKDAVDGFAGLCSTHYKEYLVDLINTNKLDPVTMYATAKIELMLTREEMAVPDNEDDDDDNTWREKLIQYVNENLPLPNAVGLPDPQPPAPVDPVQ